MPGLEGRFVFFRHVMHARGPSRAARVRKCERRTRSLCSLTSATRSSARSWRGRLPPCLSRGQMLAGYADPRTISLIDLSPLNGPPRPTHPYPGAPPSASCLTLVRAGLPGASDCAHSSMPTAHSGLSFAGTHKPCLHHRNRSNGRRKP